MQNENKIEYKINVKNVIWMYSYIDNLDIDFEYEHGSIENYENKYLHKIIRKYILKLLKQICNGVCDTNYQKHKFTNNKFKGKLNFKKSIKTIDNNIVTYTKNVISKNTQMNQVLKACIKNYFANDTEFKFFFENFESIEVIQLNKDYINKYILNKYILNKYILNKFNIQYHHNTVTYKNFFKWIKLLYVIENNKSNENSLKLPFSHNEFEKFVANFYDRKLSNNKKILKQSITRWNTNSTLFPVMKPDIKIINKLDNTPEFIVDTKFYKNMYSSKKYNDTDESITKHHTHNLYQMNTYLTNILHANKCFKKGIILYATDNEISNDSAIINHSKQIIQINTVNLNSEISNINSNLLQMVKY